MFNRAKTDKNPTRGWVLVNFCDESGNILLAKQVLAADAEQAAAEGVTIKGTLPAPPDGARLMIVSKPWFVVNC